MIGGGSGVAVTVGDVDGAGVVSSLLAHATRVKAVPRAARNVTVRLQILLFMPLPFYP